MHSPGVRPSALEGLQLAYRRAIDLRKGVFLKRAARPVSVTTEQRELCAVQQAASTVNGVLAALDRDLKSGGVGAAQITGRRLSARSASKL